MKQASSERGSAIIWLFIAVALFGALAYAFMSGTRTSTAWLENEQAKAAATGGQDCMNTVDMATKRLEARGCGALISYNSDGSPSPDGPEDGSCSIYHVNGGGAKVCGGPTTSGDPCAGSPSLGQLCSDGTIYVGLSPDGNVPMFTTPADAGAMYFNNGNNTGYIDVAADSDTAGSTNTATWASADSDSNSPGVQPHIAASYCFNLTILGHSDWYLPAADEFDVLHVNHNQGALSGTVVGNYYWTSTECFWTAACYKEGPIIGTGGGSGMKHFQNVVRCVRKGS